MAFNVCTYICLIYNSPGIIQTEDINKSLHSCFKCYNVKTANVFAKFKTHPLFNLKSHNQKYKFYHTGDTSYHCAEWACPKNTGLTYRGLQWYHRKRVFNAEDTPSLSCQSNGSNNSHIPAWPIHFY